jgi:hypothetical protein
MFSARRPYIYRLLACAQVAVYGGYERGHTMYRWGRESRRMSMRLIGPGRGEPLPELDDLGK